MKSIEFLLAGIIIGILIAPDKGSETRRKIFGKIEDYKDDAEDFINDTARKAKSTARKAKRDVEDATD